MIYANAAAVYCTMNPEECEIDGWGWIFLIAFILVCAVGLVWTEKK